MGMALFQYSRMHKNEGTDLAWRHSAIPEIDLASQ